MILQALVQHYEDLSALGKIEPPGWGSAKVSFALCLDENGELTRVVYIETEQKRGKKIVWAPQVIKNLPAPVKRSSGILSNFLCDNSSYLLGVDSKGKPKRSLECFAACKALHEEILSDVDDPAARALLAFFRNWKPEEAKEHPALQDAYDKVIGGVNLVFRYDGMYLHEIPAIRQAWQSYYDTDEEGTMMPCLVTGKTAPVAQLHPSIKGIVGAQSSGASLVSFNASAFCSYGKEQGLNAPTSQYAAFAYGAALNYLIADREHIHYIGDTALLFWAEGGDPVYQNVWNDAFFQDYYEISDFQKMMYTLSKGNYFDFQGSRLDPNCTFYVLGIAPNAARLSVRFFLRNTFGNMLKNIQEHQERLKIIHPGFDKRETLTIWSLLNETINQNARDKTPSKVLAGEMIRSVLNNERYPATLLNGVTLRIRADHKVTRGRAAIIKAYYLKNPNEKEVPKEVLTVSLNSNSTDDSYNLGRLFAILEAIQSAANPSINSTIRDRYFSSASATPAQVFPVLVNLAQKHLRKLEKGLAIHYEKEISAVAEKLGEAYPARLTLPQQGSFQLGYYHQTQARYLPKNKEEVSDE